MSKNTAIKVSGVGKTFKLPHHKNSSLKGLFLSLFDRKKGYDVQNVLNDVSFEIKEGEFFGIVGRNGSGKSTLLKILAGIYTPDAGHVALNGRLTPFIELGVGFSPELSGRDNVFLNGSLLGFTRKEMEDMYDDIVAFAELEEFMDQKVKNYSSGMQVRLAFSVAIKAQSEILLIDEVLAVGDQSFQEKCFKYFNDLKKSNRTVILVTHDMSSVEKYCDRAIIIDKGLPKAKVVDVAEAVATYNRLNYGPIEDKNDTAHTNRDVDIAIKKVEFIDSKGKVAQEFEHGKQLTVRVSIDSKHKVSPDTKLVVGLAFYDRDGVNLTGPNSSNFSFTVKEKTIDYTIESVPFPTGEYRLAAGIFDEYVKQHYDFLDNAGSFMVNSTETIHGKFTLPGVWTSRK